MLVYIAPPLVYRLKTRERKNRIVIILVITFASKIFIINTIEFIEIIMILVSLKINYILKSR